MTGAGVMMSQSPHPAAISRYLHDWLLVTVLTGRKAERSKPLASWWPCCNAMQTGDVTKKVHTSGWVPGLGGKLNHISLYCIVAIAAQHVATSPSAR